MIFDQNWRATARKSWTVRVNAAAAAIMAVVALLPFDPVVMLSVWNMMPPAVQRVAPGQTVAIVGAALFLLSLAARLRAKPGE